MRLHKFHGKKKSKESRDPLDCRNEELNLFMKRSANVRKSFLATRKQSLQTQNDSQWLSIEGMSQIFFGNRRMTQLASPWSLPLRVYVVIVAFACSFKAIKMKSSNYRKKPNSDNAKFLWTLPPEGELPQSQTRFGRFLSDKTSLWWSHTASHRWAIPIFLANEVLLIEKLNRSPRSLWFLEESLHVTKGFAVSPSSINSFALNNFTLFCVDSLNARFMCIQRRNCKSKRLIESCDGTKEQSRRVKATGKLLASSSAQCVPKSRRRNRKLWPKTRHLHTNCV